MIEEGLTKPNQTKHIIGHIGDGDHLEDWKTGMKMVQKLLEEMTGKVSLASVECVGHEFKRKRRIETVDIVNCSTEYLIWWTLKEIGRKRMCFVVKHTTIH